MKLIPALLSVFTPIAILALYWSRVDYGWDSGEQFVSSDVPAPSATWDDLGPEIQALPESSLEVHTSDRQTKQFGTQAASIGGIPKGIKPTRVIAFDEAIMPSGRRAKRRVVSTNSSLGKILVINYLDGGGVADDQIYSAEHLVVSATDQQALIRIQALMTGAGLPVAQPLPDAGFLYLRIESDSPSGIFDTLHNASALIEDWGKVELDGIGSGGGAPTDPSYNLQWHHQIIDSEPSWNITQGSSSIIVAVLDSGVNSSLTEFQNRIVSGYDFANNDANPSDDHGHGTAVIGAVAANANNGVLVAGVDWNCKIMPIKVLDSSNYGFYSWWAAGVNYAHSHGARVINLSAGGSGSSSSLTSAINNAISNGVIFVTITQNDGTGTVSYPGNLTQSITVGATERNDFKASFSNWGPSIDLVAPGRDIYTVNRFGELDWWWGTSLAAPQVSGVAALLLSLDPSLGQDSISNLLTAGAEDQVGDSLDVVGFDMHYGWGRLNAYNSLVLAQTSLGIGGSPVDGLPGWFLSDWFGFYNTDLAPWLFHAQHGFIYFVSEGSTANMFIYDDAMGAWWWTSESNYPYIYVFDPPADNARTDITSAWLWYFEGTKGPRSFGVVTGDDAGAFLFFDP